MCYIIIIVLIFFQNILLSRVENLKFPEKILNLNYESRINNNNTIVFIVSENDCAPCCVNAVNGIVTEMNKSNFLDYNTITLFLSKNEIEGHIYKKKFKTDKFIINSGTDIYQYIDSIKLELPCLLEINSNNEIIYALNNIRVNAFMFDSVIKYREHINNPKIIKPIEQFNIQEDSLNLILNISSYKVKNDSLIIIDPQQNKLFFINMKNGEIFNVVSIPDSLKFFHYDSSKHDLFYWKHLDSSFSPLIEFMNIFTVYPSLMIGAKLFYDYEVVTPKDISWFTCRTLLILENNSFKAFRLPKTIMPIGLKSFIINDDLIVNNYIIQINNNNLDSIPLLFTISKKDNEYLIKDILYAFNLGLSDKEILENLYFCFHSDSSQKFSFISMLEKKLYIYNIYTKSNSCHSLNFLDSAYQFHFIDAIGLENDYYFYFFSDNEIRIIKYNINIKQFQTYSIQSADTIDLCFLIEFKEKTVKILAKLRQNRWWFYTFKL